MASNRTFRTESGTFLEEDLGIVLWINPEFDQKPKKRLLETITSSYSNNPMAFPIKHLQKTIPLATVVDENTLSEGIFASTQEKPLIVPLPVAKSVLGWAEFYIPTSFSEIP